MLYAAKYKISLSPGKTKGAATLGIRKIGRRGGAYTLSPCVESGF